MAKPDKEGKGESHTFTANVVNTEEPIFISYPEPDNARVIPDPTENLTPRSASAERPGNGGRNARVSSYVAELRSMSASTSITGMPARDRRPIIPAEDINADILQRDLYKYGIVHDQLIYLQQITIPDTPVNREFLFKKSDTAQVIARMVTMTIVGDGIEAHSDNPEINDALNEFFLNLRGPLDDYNISDLVYDVIRDGINHGYHVSAILQNEYIPLEDAYDLDIDDADLAADHLVTDDPKPKALQIHRLDARTVQKATHPTTGAKKFVQEVLGPAEIPSNKKFMSMDYNPTMKTPYGMTTDFDNSRIYRVNLKPKKVFYVDLFREPPIAPVLDMIAHRTWLLWAQKKVGLKYAAPVPVVRVGTPEDYTEDLNTRLSELQAVSDYLSDLRFGDGIALDYNMEWVGAAQAGNNVGFEFVKVIDSLDKRIALAIGSSMALFEASGAELATSRTIQDTFLRWISGVRTKLDRAITILCYKYLKARAIPFKRNDFELKFSPLRERMMGEVVNAIRAMWDSGLITDIEEGRAMGQGIFDLEHLDETENKTYMDIIREKAYSDAKGRADAQVEMQKEMNKMDLAHQKSLKAAGIIAAPTAAGGGTSKPAANPKSNKKPQTNPQGSTQQTQAGDRKRGPQKDSGSASQSGSERSEQNIGKK